MVPPGKTCVAMEYYCFEDDALWGRSDVDLLALATRELAALGLAAADVVRDGTVVRVPKAYPIYDEPYPARLASVRRHIDQIANLHSVGRNGMHKYNNQDHSMLAAMMTVSNMRGAGHDVWALNTDSVFNEQMSVSPGLPARATR